MVNDINNYIIKLNILYIDINVIDIFRNKKLMIVIYFCGGDVGVRCMELIKQ